MKLFIVYCSIFFSAVSASLFAVEYLSPSSEFTDDAEESSLNIQADQIAEIILKAFQKYYDEDFKHLTQRASERFQEKKWNEIQSDTVNRLNLYQESIDLLYKNLNQGFFNQFNQVASVKDQYEFWVLLKQKLEMRANQLYEGDLIRIYFDALARKYFTFKNKEFDYFSDDEWPDIFSEEMSQQDVGRVYEPIKVSSILNLIQDLVQEFSIDNLDLSQNAIRQASQQIEDSLKENGWSVTEIMTFDRIQPIFYRNKSAYLIGQLKMGDRFVPIALQFRNDDEGGIRLNKIFIGTHDVGNLFTYTRANFHVEIDYYRELIEFLKQILPQKKRSQLYTAIGYNAVAQYRLIDKVKDYAQETGEKFTRTPGAPGMMMITFTLPSQPTIFKVIRDFSTKLGASKQSVLTGYRKVHYTDRAGRLLGGMRYRNVGFKIWHFEMSDIFQKYLMRWLQMTLDYHASKKGLLTKEWSIEKYINFGVKNISNFSDQLSEELINISKKFKLIRQGGIAFQSRFSSRTYESAPYQSLGVEDGNIIKASKPTVLEELLTEATQNSYEGKNPTVRIQNDEIVFDRIYAQFQTIPLDVFLATEKDPDLLKRVVLDWGFCLKDLYAMGFFLNDVYPKNFGVTRSGRVIVYDFDDLENFNQFDYRLRPIQPDNWNSMNDGDWHEKGYHHSGDHIVYIDEIFQTYLKWIPPEIQEEFVKIHQDMLQLALFEKMKQLHQKEEVIDIPGYSQNQLGFSQAVIPKIKKQALYNQVYGADATVLLSENLSGLLRLMSQVSSEVGILEPEDFDLFQTVYTNPVYIVLSHVDKNLLNLDESYLRTLQDRNIFFFLYDDFIPNENLPQMIEWFLRSTGGHRYRFNEDADVELGIRSAA